MYFFIYFMLQTCGNCVCVCVSVLMFRWLSAVDFGSTLRGCEAMWLDTTVGFCLGSLCQVHGQQICFMSAEPELSLMLTVTVCVLGQSLICLCIFVCLLVFATQPLCRLCYTRVSAFKHRAVFKQTVWLMIAFTFFCLWRSLTGYQRNGAPTHPHITLYSIQQGQTGGGSKHNQTCFILLLFYNIQHLLSESILLIFYFIFCCDIL